MFGMAAYNFVVNVGHWQFDDWLTKFLNCFSIESDVLILIALVALHRT